MRSLFSFRFSYCIFFIFFSKCLQAQIQVSDIQQEGYLNGGYSLFTSFDDTNFLVENYSNKISVYEVKVGDVVPMYTINSKPLGHQTGYSILDNILVDGHWDGVLIYDLRTMMSLNRVIESAL